MPPGPAVAAKALPFRADGLGWIGMDWDGLAWNVWVAANQAGLAWTNGK